MSLLSQLMRLPYARGLWLRSPVGSVASRVEYGIYRYPHYAYGIYWAAVQASRLGTAAISAIEFGVAGGRGLLAMERASAEIQAETGVRIDVFGFDTGEGLPPPVDYRDLPHIWGHGFYKMEPDKLRARLRSAELILGNVAQTVDAWLQREHPAPLGFAAFDLDFYSSTVAALRVFQGPPASHLPRVHCYFDDVASNDLGCMNPYVGELLAIREFNDAHADRKICRIEQLRSNRTAWEKWQERMFAFHNFSHPDYTRPLVSLADASSQLGLG
jgi:hypothetical protein